MHCVYGTEGSFHTLMCQLYGLEVSEIITITGEITYKQYRDIYA